MPYQVQQSTTAFPLVFFMTDSSDHLTGKTGLTVTVTLSKSGAAFGAASGAVSEIANGWYKVAGNATDSATLGPLALHATATGADATDMLYEVVAFNPQDATRLGLTALPNAAAAATGGLATVDASNAVKVQSGTGANQISLSSGVVTVGTNNDKTGYSLSAAQTFNVTGNITGNLSGSVGSVTGAVGSVTGNVAGSVASVTGVVSANITKVNGVTVNGDGSATKWGP